MTDSAISSRRRRPASSDVDLVRLWELHTEQASIRHDVEGAMRTMVAEPHVLHVPAATGGRGPAGVHRFYGEMFVGRSPRDADMVLISRTVGADRVVDEMLFSFTHDVAMPWMLPGVPPTGRRVEIPLVAIVTFRDGRIESEHVYWDQASVLAQLGLLSPNGLPVLGAPQARYIVTGLLRPTRSLHWWPSAADDGLVPLLAIQRRSAKCR